jgi:hypothetical protein
MKKNTPSRFALPALMLIFIVPALMSWLLFRYHDNFQFKTTNLGTLVRPAVVENDLAIATPADQKWQIVYAPRVCDDAASKKMFVLHQLHTALGKDQDRVSMTLLLNGNCEMPAHDFRKLKFTPEQIWHLENVLSNTSLATADQIYLLDPLGNLFMYYSGDVNPMHVLKDIKKVLEVSQIG